MPDVFERLCADLESGVCSAFQFTGNGKSWTAHYRRPDQITNVGYTTARAPTPRAALALVYAELDGWEYI